MKMFLCSISSFNQVEQKYNSFLSALCSPLNYVYIRLPFITLSASDKKLYSVHLIIKYNQHIYISIICWLGDCLSSTCSTDYSWWLPESCHIDEVSRTNRGRACFLWVKSVLHGHSLHFTNSLLLKNSGGLVLVFITKFNTLCLVEDLNSSNIMEINLKHNWLTLLPSSKAL